MKPMIRHQIFAVIFADLHVFLYGLHNAWANANFLRLQSPTTKLPSGPLTYEQASTLMSILGIGAFLGNIAYSRIVLKFGSKQPLMLLAIPHFVGWLLVIFAENVYWLYASRLLIAFAVGSGFLCVPIFVSEISSDKIRLILCSINHLANCTGNFVGLCASVFLDYHEFAKLAIAVPILFLLLLSSVPESPKSLTKQGRLKEAEIALKYYKGDYDLPEGQMLTTQEISEKEIPISFKDFCTTSAKKAVFISLCCAFFMQFSGFLVVTSNSTAIFADAGSKLSPLQSSIVLYIVETLAVLIGAFLIDRVGRVPLLITSQIGVVILLSILSVHHLLKDQIPECNWIPFYGVILAVFTYMIGFMLVPSTLIIDVLPHNIRHILIIPMQSTAWICNFGTNFLFFKLLPIIKLHGCFLLFVNICLGNLLFTLLFVPETKGKSYDQIQHLLAQQECLTALSIS